VFAPGESANAELALPAAITVKFPLPTLAAAEELVSAKVGKTVIDDTEFATVRL
jgi:hypothetical protein